MEASSYNKIVFKHIKTLVMPTVVAKGKAERIGATGKESTRWTRG